MKLILIAALARNRVIGKDGTVPWDIPEDIERFKRLTIGHTVLMGRGTYQVLGSPLSNRRNVVLSSSKIPGVETYPTIADALKALQNEEDIYVIGGGQVYAQLLTSAAELRLTLVDQTVEGDTYFPPYEHLIGSVFRKASEEKHDGYSFVNFARIV
jgi:dihydrofolate reductase